MEKDSPILYCVDKEYLKYLHKKDFRVSVKFNNRPFAGIVTSVGNKKYMIQLTSQTTEERKKEGKKKRSALITTFVTETDTYESNEIRYLRKNWESVEKKAANVYNQRYDTKSPNFDFLKRTCCDFKKLEIALDRYNE